MLWGTPLMPSTNFSKNSHVPKNNRLCSRKAFNSQDHVQTLAFQFTPQQKRQMLALVRASIAEQFGQEASLQDAPEEGWWQQISATFVTLTLRGELKGCIGCLDAYQSLREGLQHNAVNAAFRDFRFQPLTQEEFGHIKIEISILTPAVVLTVASEAELIEKLRPNIDGLVLEEGRFKATFLPQVWQQLPEPQQFIRHLKHKAGLAVNHWSDDLKCSVYQVQEISEPL